MIDRVILSVENEKKTTSEPILDFWAEPQIFSISFSAVKSLEFNSMSTPDEIDLKQTVM